MPIYDNDIEITNENFNSSPFSLDIPVNLRSGVNKDRTMPDSSIFNQNKISPEIVSMSSSQISDNDDSDDDESETNMFSSSNKQKKDRHRNKQHRNKHVKNKYKSDNRYDDDNRSEDSDEESEQSYNSNGSSKISVRKAFRLENEEKRKILYQLDRLKSRGHHLPCNFTMQSNIEEMRNVYERIKREKEIDASIRFQRKMLMGGVTGIEFINTRYDPFAIRLEGWSEQVHDNIDDYDDIFEELHEKYRDSGSDMAPELKLLISLGGSAFMFHLTKRMFSESSIPNVEEILKSNPELMKKFQNASAKQYMNMQSRGEGDNASTYQQQSVPENRNTSQVGADSIFGMVSNLFNGMTSSQGQDSSMFQSVNGAGGEVDDDIDEIINDVHNNIMISPDDNYIETMTVTDEEITSIIEDTEDMLNLSSTGKKRKPRGPNKKKTSKELNL
jgi:hypothetical protein